MSLYDRWLDYMEHFQPILPELMPKKIQIRTIDSDRYLRHVQDLDSGIQANFQLDKQVPENSGPAMAMREKQIVRRLVDKSHYGVEIRTVNIPFKDDSGCISLTYNVDLEVQISVSMERIAAASQQISASSEEINRSGSLMYEQFFEMKSMIQDVFEHSNEMKTIAGVVKEINDQLKLISINALIEAAHAGEHGRGFSVVAAEVRKLSDSSFQQIKRVNETAAALLQNMGKATNAVDQIDRDLRHQTLSSNDIHVAIADVAESISRLKDVLDMKLDLH